MNIAALAIAGVLTLSPPSGSTCLHNCHIDDAGLALLKHFEGYSPFPYADAVGVQTIGFGHAIRPGEAIPAPLLGQAAQTLLESDANGKAVAINRLVKVPLRSQQADALISFTFNLGEATLARSTLLREVNLRRDAAVPEQFLRYDHAGGRVLTGLLVRRKAEAALYVAGE